MRVREFLEIIESYARRNPNVLDYHLTVLVADKGFPAKPSVDVKDVIFGFDWNSGRLMIETEPKVKRLIKRLKGGYNKIETNS